MSEVFVVEWGDELPAEVDSIYAAKPDANKRAAELNEASKSTRWQVTRWVVRERFLPGEATKG